MAWWDAFRSRVREWVRRATPYVDLWLHKAIRFTKSSRWFPGAVVSFLSAVIVAFSIRWQALGPSLDRPAWWMLLAAAIFYLNAIACQAFVLRILMLEQFSYVRSFVNLNEGALIDVLMPLRLGDAGRAFLLARSLGLRMYQLRSAMRVERFYNILLAVSLMMVAVLVSVGALWLKPIAFLLLVIFVGVLFSLPFLAKQTGRLRGLSDRAAAFLPEETQPALRSRVSSLLDGLTVLADWRVFAESLVWTMLAWLFRVAGLMVLIKGVFPAAPLGFGMFAMAVLALGSQVPAAPARLGVYGGAIVLALALLGVDATSALAVALTSHLFDILLPLALGGRALFNEGETWPRLYEKLAAFQ